MSTAESFDTGQICCIKRRLFVELVLDQKRPKDRVGDKKSERGVSRIQKAFHFHDEMQGDMGERL